MGSDGLFYDPFDNKFVYKENSGATIWSEDPTVIPAGSVVSQYRLYTYISIFTVMNANGIGGAVYDAVDEALSEIPYEDSTT